MQKKMTASDAAASLSKCDKVAAVDGIQQLIMVLANDTMRQQARDIINVLSVPEATNYVRGTDPVAELAGIETCLAFLRQGWPNVGDAGGLTAPLKERISRQPLASVEESAPVPSSPEKSAPIPDDPAKKGRKK